MLSQRQLFLQHLAQTSDFPLMLEIERAEGIYMYDRKGRPIIDLISGIGVSNVGHRHPAVLKAVHKQLDRYMHLMVYGELVQTPQVRLAKALAETLPEPLQSVYLVNSGSEAIEGAMKLAKRATGRTEFISAMNAYHGSSHGALSVGGGEHFKNAFRPLLPDVRQIRFGHWDDLELISERTAAVLLETVQGEAGVRVPPPGYLKAVREQCDRKGALLILDEIQCGFGRTGTFWAFEQFEVQPDILVAAKGMGGGMPIGAFIASTELMSVFKNNPILGHITTFGGHPVSAAAALATLKVIRREKLYAKAARTSQLFHKYLSHPAIKEIRSCGLMMAAEFDSFARLKPVIDQAIRQGVLTDWFLYCDNSMRIAPPLIITPAQVKQACKLILKAIRKVDG